MKLPRKPVRTGRYFYQNATLLSTLSESIVPSTTPWGSRFEDTLKTFHLILLAVCVSQIHTGESREFHFYLSFFSSNFTKVRLVLFISLCLLISEVPGWQAYIFTLLAMCGYTYLHHGYLWASER